MAAVAFVGPALGVGAAGGFATASNIPTWYATLQKPCFNPPNWIFGPVWTTLYVLMGLAAWRVWRTRANDSRAAAALGVYAGQLVLNLAWSFVFFQFHRPLWALIDIIALLMSIGLAATLFWRLDKLAGLMMAPYLAWVSFATLLNFEIWRLNG